ncbi:class I SAM-dependent methyltransferase [Cognatilysobacter lacus]|nr:class I SAM-dependent methyltransferase [Lysobacter lacus]
MTAKAGFKRMLAHVFHMGQRLGVDVLPRHFYSEIPDIRKLRATQHWRKPFSMTGVTGADLPPQRAFLETTMRAAGPAATDPQLHQAACARNGEPGFGRIESQFLYAFVRAHRPQRIVQVGCGVSTAVCLAAIKDAGYAGRVTCIEPYPTKFLLDAHRDGEIELVRAAVESLDYGFLQQLRDGDLFFVDSTHTLGPAGEVTRIILEMLPRLSDGVYAHFHDIAFPYDYQGDILTSALFCWHETTLLHGFLTFNDRFRILASLSMLHFGEQSALRAMFPDYDPRQNIDGLTLCEGDYPSSIYLRCARPA